MKLMLLFKESLKNIEDMHIYERATGALVQVVKRDWQRLRREMRNCLEVFFIL